MTEKRYYLEGRKALITGTSAGIGRAIASNLINAGARVAMNFRTNGIRPSRATRYMDEIETEAWVYPARTSDLDEAKNLRKHVNRHFGKIDILVNDVGIGLDRAAREMDRQEWSKVVSTYLDSANNCINVFHQDLAASGHGRIMNMITTDGRLRTKGRSNYGALRSGIIDLTKTFAKDVARKKVTANVIVRGYLDIDMDTEVPDALKQNILSMIPLKRLGDPEEVAGAVIYLASDDADYITGQMLAVDGGMSN